jgi:hypothetical protein
LREEFAIIRQPGKEQVSDLVEKQSAWRSFQRDTGCALG